MFNVELNGEVVTAVKGRAKADLFVCERIIGSPERFASWAIVDCATGEVVMKSAR